MSSGSGDVTSNIHCNLCRHYTRHRFVYKHDESGSDDETGVSWSNGYELFECCGCLEVVLRRTSWFSEYDRAQISYFPPRVSRWMPHWQWALPSETRALLTEVYTALQADSLILAMMGARALIETAMVKKVGDRGSFAKHLQAMVDGGFLSQNNREFLAVALDAGSASAHRAHVPDAPQLNTVIDIAENLLQSLFVLGEETRKLKRRFPLVAARRKRHPSRSSAALDWLGCGPDTRGRFALKWLVHASRCASLCSSQLKS